MRPALILLYSLTFALTGCAQPQYRNSAHPDYGAVEFNKDQDDCQRQNSHVVTTQGNYVETSHPVVDQDKAQACLAARGWQRTQN
jgi:hypothetical protein